MREYSTLPRVVMPALYSSISIASPQCALLQPYSCILAIYAAKMKKTKTVRMNQKQANQSEVVNSIVFHAVHVCVLLLCYLP